MCIDRDDGDDEEDDQDDKDTSKKDDNGDINDDNDKNGGNSGNGGNGDDDKNGGNGGNGSNGDNSDDDKNGDNAGNGSNGDNSGDSGTNDKNSGNGSNGDNSGDSGKSGSNSASSNDNSGGGGAGDNDVDMIKASSITVEKGSLKALRKNHEPVASGDANVDQLGFPNGSKYSKVGQLVIGYGLKNPNYVIECSLTSDPDNDVPDERIPYVCYPRILKDDTQIMNIAGWFKQELAKQVLYDKQDKCDIKAVIAKYGNTGSVNVMNVGSGDSSGSGDVEEKSGVSGRTMDNGSSGSSTDENADSNAATIGTSPSPAAVSTSGDGSVKGGSPSPAPSVTTKSVSNNIVKIVATKPNKKTKAVKPTTDASNNNIERDSTSIASSSDMKVKENNNDNTATVTLLPSDSTIELDFSSFSNIETSKISWKTLIFEQRYDDPRIQPLINQLGTNVDYSSIELKHQLNVSDKIVVAKVKDYSCVLSDDIFNQLDERLRMANIDDFGVLMSQPDNGNVVQLLDQAMLIMRSWLETFFRCRFCERLYQLISQNHSDSQFLKMNYVNARQYEIDKILAGKTTMQEIVQVGLETETARLNYDWQFRKWPLQLRPEGQRYDLCNEQTYVCQAKIIVDFMNDLEQKLQTQMKQYVYIY